jgi:UDP-glucose 4-epimerase
VKIGITGGAGFIGSNLARSLSHDGYEIVILDDLSTGLLTNLKDFDCEFINGSLTNSSVVAEFIDHVDFVFHLAARGSVPRSISDPQQTFDTNVLGTQTLLEGVRKKNLPVVFSSSSSVYGDNPDLPKHEMVRLSPISPYAASKASGEFLITSYEKSYRLSCRIFRFFNVYGPGQRPDHIYSAVIPKWIWAALKGEELKIFGDGNHIRDFTFIDDVVAVLRHSISSKVHLEGPINLALGNPVSLNQLVGLLQNWFPDLEHRFLPSRLGDVKSSYNNPEKLFSFMPNLEVTGLRHGLEVTIEWLQQEHMNRQRQESNESTS